jgi:2,3-bisphosphoglycerate-dependent phosphoglycerate mutase
MRPTSCLYLVRHAQSANNALPDHQRVCDPAITPLGRVQAELLAGAIERYAPTLWYCSPFLRTLQTLLPISQRVGERPIVRQDLYEQGSCHSGHLPNKRIAEPGMRRSEIEALCPGWQLEPRIGERGWNDRTEYETLEQSRERAQSVRVWFDNHHQLHAQHRVALMIHADFKVRLLEAFLGISDLEHRIAEPVNTSVSCLIRESGRWQLGFWNHHDHLPSDKISS